MKKYNVELKITDQDTGKTITANTTSDSIDDLANKFNVHPLTELYVKIKEEFEINKEN